MSFIPNIYETEVDIVKDEWANLRCECSHISGVFGRKTFKMYLTHPATYAGKWEHFTPYINVGVIGHWYGITLMIETHYQIVNEFAITLKGLVAIPEITSKFKAAEKDAKLRFGVLINSDLLNDFLRKPLIDIRIEDEIYSFIDNTPYYNTVEEGQLLFQMICQKVYEGHKMIKEESPIDIKHESL